MLTLLAAFGEFNIHEHARAVVTIVTAVAFFEFVIILHLLPDRKRR